MSDHSFIQQIFTDSCYMLASALETRSEVRLTCRPQKLTGCLGLWPPPKEAWDSPAAVPTPEGTGARDSVLCGAFSGRCTW